nr:hypothetical protein Iba_chr08aCG5180 [Ipomoea batatas]GMD23407.1 hypothetical protein Iba_chr08bCG4970 [Ipomoea batatas]
MTIEGKLAMEIFNRFCHRSTISALEKDEKRKKLPGKGSGIPTRRNSISNFINENKRIAINMNIKENDEIPIHSQTLRVPRVCSPRPALKPEHRVEHPGRDLPRHGRFPVEKLRHLIKVEDVGLVARAVAFIALDINGDIADGAESRYEELSGVRVVQHHQPLFSLAVFQPEIRR